MTEDEAEAILALADEIGVGGSTSARQRVDPDAVVAMTDAAKSREVH